MFVTKDKLINLTSKTSIIVTYRHVLLLWAVLEILQHRNREFSKLLEEKSNWKQKSEFNSQNDVTFFNLFYSSTTFVGRTAVTGY